MFDFVLLSQGADKENSIDRNDKESLESKLMNKLWIEFLMKLYLPAKSIWRKRWNHQVDLHENARYSVAQKFYYFHIQLVFQYFWLKRLLFLFYCVNSMTAITRMFMICLVWLFETLCTVIGVHLPSQQCFWFFYCLLFYTEPTLVPWRLVSKI